MENRELMAERAAETENFEFLLPAERSKLPDHIFAVSVKDQLNAEPMAVEVDGRVAVFVVFETTESQKLSFLWDYRALNENEKLFLYEWNEELGQVWTQHSRRNLSEFRSGKLVVEWNGSPEAAEKLDFSTIFRNVYLEHELGQASDTGFGESWDCHLNVNCPEGEPFGKVKDGVARVMVVVEEGIGYCSGALINNTAEDHTPYILTAFHCMDGLSPVFDQWRFDFYYEGTDCENPLIEPEFISLRGCVYRAGHFESDFMLLEITDPLPLDFSIPFIGWDRRPDYLPANTALIQHPAGDIKKVARYSNLLRIHGNNIFWDNGVTTPRSSHYRQNLTAGTFQPGSSGGPLLSPEGRIMGQLHGGNSSCVQFLAYSGILHYSWDLGDSEDERLRDWLDPLNTGQMTLDHSLLEPDYQTASITGRVLNPVGEPVGMVQVELQCGPVELSYETEANGEFEFSFEFLEELSCELSFSKNINPRNGINVLDIVDIRRDILDISQLDDDQRKAADLMDNQLVNVLDIVEIRRLILGIYDEFPKVESWKIFPQKLDFVISESFEQDFEVKGIKMGDLDYSADSAK
nr:trypsin-like serine protease [Saprospiraceae bacterium]